MPRRVLARMRRALNAERRLANLPALPPDFEKAEDVHLRASAARELGVPAWIRLRALRPTVIPREAAAVCGQAMRLALQPAQEGEPLPPEPVVPVGPNEQRFLEAKEAIFWARLARLRRSPDFLVEVRRLAARMRRGEAEPAARLRFDPSAGWTRRGSGG